MILITTDTCDRSSSCFALFPTPNSSTGCLEKFYVYEKLREVSTFIFTFTMNLTCFLLSELFLFGMLFNDCIPPRPPIIWTGKPPSYWTAGGILLYGLFPLGGGFTFLGAALRFAREIFEWRVHIISFEDLFRFFPSQGSKHLPFPPENPHHPNIFFRSPSDEERLSPSLKGTLTSALCPPSPAKAPSSSQGGV